MKALLALNLLLVVILAWQYLPRKQVPVIPDTDPGSSASRAPSSGLGSQVGIGSPPPPGPIFESGQWRLPESALQGVMIESVTSSDPPRFSDEICAMISATDEERAGLDSELAAAAEHIRSLETENMELLQGEDDTSWVRLREHSDKAKADIAMLRRGIIDIVGDDRGPVVMQGIKTSDYFCHVGMETEIFFELAEEGVSFAMKRYLNGAPYADDSITTSTLRDGDGFDRIRNRYGHLVDIEMMEEYLDSLSEASDDPS